ncbi:MAG: hypothetical protein PHQ05_01085 [Sterolibacterium sp.]|nr:hypothetical protein [Sterolibacterium sp.]
MNKSKCFLLPLCFAVVASLPIAANSAKPAAPFVNPYVAASTYSVVHGTGNLTPVAGPVAPSHRLGPEEVIWKPTGPINGILPMYSGPYPNGKRTIWIGGYDRVAKLDADTLEVLTTYAKGGNTYFGNDEIDRFIATADRLQERNHKEYLDYVLKFWKEPFKSAESAYRFVSRENEFYLSHRGSDGQFSLQVYGEADPADPASPISLRREWKSPPEMSGTKVFSINMTSDGTVAIVTMDGVLMALPRDFSTYQVLKLPRKGEETGATNQDYFSAFVRNGMSVDDRNGIYVVTRDNMHRVQWTGSALSLDEADGAWTAPYPNENLIGSGGTPQLMGWGPNEDHLVVDTDASKNNKLMVFWRDAIPSDWKGLPGYDRRVAGVAPIHFGVSENERILIENTPIVYGYGAFINNTYLEHGLPEQGSPTRQWIAECYSSSIPGYEARGGAMFQWDPQARVLKQVWQSRTNFVGAVCTVSSANNILYCWGARNREWTLEGTDWNTGKSVFHYTMGKSNRFAPLGGPVFIQPNGDVTCGCGGGLGIVRVKPRTKR